MDEIDFMTKRLEELIVQQFPRRCPYCEKEITYEEMDLKLGENPIKCPSCKKSYIKIVTSPLIERD